MSLKINRVDRGWAVLGTGASLIILMVVAVWATSIFNDYMQQRAWQVTASQASRFRAAVKNYVGRYYDTLLASAGTTNPVLITTTMLKNTGLIEPGFSETTSDGQVLSAAVVRNATNTDQLQALVISQGGGALPFKALRNISVDIEGLGGYVWKNANITGAMESWSVPMITFSISTTDGHIAALIPADELGVARQESDRLYRFSVTGKPDLNRMHTDIDMGTNNLNNANSVNGQNGNFSANVNATNNVSAGQNVTAGGGITANGDIRSNGGSLITRNNQGWYNETHGGGFYMSDNDWVRAFNNKNIYTGGQVRGGSVRADGRLSTGETLQLDQVNNVGWGCSPNGLVSRDASGAVLSCQLGVWTASGKMKNFQMVSGGAACGAYISSTAYCPAGKQMLSGGFVLSRWGGNGWNSPDLSTPSSDGNGWQIYTGGGVSGGSCITPVAWCASN